MAGGAQSLRLCLRGYRQAPALRIRRRPEAVQFRRALSTTIPRRDAKEQDDAEDDFDRDYKDFGEVWDHMLRNEALSKTKKEKLLKEQDVWRNQVPEDSKRNIRKHFQAISREASDLDRAVRPRAAKFWNEDETDPDLITEEVGEDEFEEDDILSMAHGKLEEHRELREYARLAIWEMPLLSKLAKPFEPPAAGEVLRFRYTSYMGEFHPAEKKVVVEFCPKDLDLTEQQQLKLMKLAGPRYNPEKDIIRMSCEMFEHQAQNKRYLGDLVEKLIVEAKDPADTFEDIPLDTRHHTFKTKPKFPKEWRMTEERRAELEAIRREAFLRDQSKKKEGSLVDGLQRIQHALAPPAPKVQDKVAELLTVPAQRRGGPKARR